MPWILKNYLASSYSEPSADSLFLCSIAGSRYDVSPVGCVGKQAAYRFKLPGRFLCARRLLLLSQRVPF